LDIHEIDSGVPVEPPEIPEIEEAPKTSRWWSMVSETLETLVLAAIMVLVINTVSARIRVDGVSMEPSFFQNEFVVVNKLAYKFGDIERGDVVVFPYPNNPEDDYIKRVIGLPGDHVEILDGGVYVNGVLLDEPYIAEAPRQNYTIDVQDDNLFLLGDNRNRSSDSRVWGTLPIEDVIGKAVFTYWPFSAFGPVIHYDQDSTVESIQ
jgi:signal peptidase I